MDYARYTGLKDNAKTIFVAGIVSALSVDTASNELKLEWIEKELKQLEEELNKIETDYDMWCEAEDIKDPFVDLGVK
jgi:uncharacterized beta-barrel protein YwiB (DUF1934 family)